MLSVECWVGAAQCLILEHESNELNESLTPHGVFRFPTDLTDFRRFLTPHGVFCFPTDYTDFHRFLTPHGVFACESWWEPLRATKRICANLWDLWETSLSFWLLTEFLRWDLVRTVACNEEYLWETLSESQCKDTTFHFTNSPMLTDTHRYSPIFTDKYQGFPKWKKI